MAKRSSSGRDAGRPRDSSIDEAVLATARAHLAQFGYGGLSLVAVAEESGTTRQAIYRRWASKADLATAAIASLRGGDAPVTSDNPYVDLVVELEGVSRRCVAS